MQVHHRRPVSPINGLVLALFSTAAHRPRTDMPDTIHGGLLWQDAIGADMVLRIIAMRHDIIAVIIRSRSVGLTKMAGRLHISRAVILSSKSHTRSATNPLAALRQ